MGRSGVREWRPALEYLRHSPTTRELWHEFRQVEVIHVDPFPSSNAKLLSDDELTAPLEQTRLNLPPGDQDRQG